MENESVDDSDIPLEVIVSETLGRQISDVTVLQSHGRCVSHWEKNSESGRLVANDKNKDIWPWNNEGKKWGGKLPVQGTD